MPAAGKQMLVIFVAAVTLCAVAAQAPLPPVEEVNHVCLGCICEAISGCNRTLTCEGDICGLFRITWAYWADAGKPTQKGESPDSPQAYPNCVNEPVCAARAVQGYMDKYKQDCNRDGVVNCQDYAALHKLGGYGCGAPLPESYVNRFQACLNQVAQIQG